MCFYIYLITLMLMHDHWFHAVFITTITRQRKKDIGKIEKYSKTNVYVVCVCVCVCVFLDYICVLLCVVVYVIVSMCVYDDTCVSPQI